MGRRHRRARRPIRARPTTDNRNETLWFAFRSSCTPTRCVTTAARLSDTNQQAPFGVTGTDHEVIGTQWLSLPSPAQLVRQMRGRSPCTGESDLQDLWPERQRGSAPVAPHHLWHVRTGNLTNPSPPKMATPASGSRRSSSGLRGHSCHACATRTRTPTQPSSEHPHSRATATRLHLGAQRIQTIQRRGDADTPLRRSRTPDR
jgi:hypothetical protein